MGLGVANITRDEAGANGHAVAAKMHTDLEAAPVPAALELGERALADFYSAMAQRARCQRLKRQRCGYEASTAKLNRENLYLDGHQRRAAEVASRTCLSRRVAREVAGVLLPAGGGGVHQTGERRFVGLQRCLAMQHFVDTDLEDLVQPEEARRSDDKFLPADGSRPERGFCEQMLLDATRCTYIVGDQRFDFFAELEAEGLDMENAPDEVDARKAPFLERLANAVRLCLETSVGPPVELVKAITVAMCQSGLANLERACPGPEVVVCGGEQEVRFELRAAAEEQEIAWDVTLEVRKTGFGACMIFEHCTEQEDDPEPSLCGPGCCVARSAVVRYGLVGTASGTVAAEVREVHEEIRLHDELQRPLPLSARRSAELGDVEVAEAAAKSEVQARGLRQFLFDQLSAFAMRPLRLALSAPRATAASCTAGLTAAAALAEQATNWARRGLRLATVPLVLLRPLVSNRSAADAQDGGKDRRLDAEAVLLP